jgi:hypothetical protein
MDVEAKAKLASKLTHALHQAPNHPETFINVLRQMIGTAGLHITDLAITFGDLTGRMAEQLRAARSSAQPTFENLIDLAGTKINLGRKPERALSNVLRVPLTAVQECRRLGRVPRAWFEKITALPDLGETHAHIDSQTAHVVRLLADSGHSPEEINAIFQKVRTSRAGLRQISKVAHEHHVRLDATHLMRMQGELFGEAPDAQRRFGIWLLTQLRIPINDPRDLVHKLNRAQIERLRERHRREISLRQTDAAYRKVAAAAELIARPLKPVSRASPTDREADARRLRSYLDRLFGDGIAERYNARLSQLTGLDDRHTLDLLSGANGTGQQWWRFLDAVDAKMNPPDDAPLLQRMGDGYARQPLGTGAQ